MAKKWVPVAVLLLVAVLSLSSTACFHQPYSVGLPDSLFSEYTLAWNLADQYYSSFVVHQDVDWDAEFLERRAQAMALTDRDQLNDLLADLFSTLSDGQIFIFHDNTMIPAYRPDHFINFDSDVWNAYMQEWNCNQLSFSGLTYGFATPDSAIGYVCISTNALDEDQLYPVFYDVTSSMQACSGIIIDLRNCTGTSGFYDALQISGRFMDQAYLGLYRQYRNGPGRLDLDEPYPVYTFRQGGWQFTGPVLVLTGRGTAGFAEVLALLISTPSYVNLVGDITAGAPDISRPFPLNNPVDPNDRTLLYLSGVVIYDTSMNAVAGVGVTPDIPVTVTPEDFAAGIDPVLEAAVELLSKTPPMR